LNNGTQVASILATQRALSRRKLSIGADASCKLRHYEILQRQFDLQKNADFLIIRAGSDIIDEAESFGNNAVI
jgi:hypothetical protein